jgi:hypothetical protein
MPAVIQVHVQTITKDDSTPPAISCPINVTLIVQQAPPANTGTATARQLFYVYDHLTDVIVRPMPTGIYTHRHGKQQMRVAIPLPVSNHYQR